MQFTSSEIIDSGAAAQVCDFIHGLRLEDLPPEVVRQARHCFLDLLSCTFAGIPSRAAQIARNFATALGGSPECSLFGDGRRVPLPLAVFANSTACEALDCDDGYNLIKGHPGAFLAPMILAWAEAKGLAGDELITGLVVGYELAMRSGLLVHRLYGYYHGSGSWGGVGTAAVTARILRLNEEATLHALGAAEYHGTLAPIMRCVSYPGMVKDGVGWGAFAGVSAALLAAAGMTASPPHLVLKEAAPEMSSLGRRFLILDLYFKNYCACRWAHAPVRAALLLARQHRLPWDAIERIQVETFAEACALSRKVPASSEDAQYSVAYPVAAALLHGEVGPDQVLEEHYLDPRTAELCQRTEFLERPDYQAVFPQRRLAEVKITAAGKTYSSGTVSADPSEPWSDSDFEDKFRSYVRPYLTEADAEDLITKVARLETLSPHNIQAIVARLAVAGRGAGTSSSTPG